MLAPKSFLHELLCIGGVGDYWWTGLETAHTMDKPISVLYGMDVVCWGFLGSEIWYSANAACYRKAKALQIISLASQNQDVFGVRGRGQSHTLM